jgi:hypothetical protein
LPRTYFIVVVRRSIGFWIGLRLLLAMVMAYGQLAGGERAGLGHFDPASLIQPQPVMLLLVVSLLLFDARAAGEDLLIANFGVSRLQLGLAGSLAPAALESLLVLGAVLFG